MRGGQVACLVAETLGINKILIHPYAGVLSAYGIGLADIRVTRVESVELVLTPELVPQLESLFASAIAKIKREEIDLAADNVAVIRQLNLKYAGTNSTLTVDFDSNIAKMNQAFATEHQTRYAGSFSQKKSW